jgi:hypothetical protein
MDLYHVLPNRTNPKAWCDSLANTTENDLVSLRKQTTSGMPRRIFAPPQTKEDSIKGDTLWLRRRLNMEVDLQS